jgi:hypothetical protein
LIGAGATLGQVLGDDPGQRHDDLERDDPVEQHGRHRMGRREPGGGQRGDQHDVHHAQSGRDGAEARRARARAPDEQQLPPRDRQARRLDRAGQAGHVGGPVEQGEGERLPAGPVAEPERTDPGQELADQFTGFGPRPADDPPADTQHHQDRALEHGPGARDAQRDQDRADQRGADQAARYGQDRGGHVPGGQRARRRDKRERRGGEDARGGEFGEFPAECLAMVEPQHPGKLLRQG